LGLELEPLGSNEFLLRSVQAILKNTDHAELMREIVDLLPRQKENETLQEKYEEILVMMACRNAIKVNTPMELDQIRKLLSDLEQTEMPYTCPHGRPIALLFGMDDILKRFLRK
ncbi:MAG: DNA mismatch repair protein MutL, partial [Nitrospinaceae bacterium]